jgi:diguanylate cyclase (GGDEF)-like protein/PAS domain S-box-containing protein
MYIVLIILGLIGNFLSIEIFFGIEQIFGSIFVLLSVWLFGPILGVFSAIIVNFYTLELFGHPYVYISLILETFVVGLLLSNKKVNNILIADLVYWVFIGIWLVPLFYGNVMEMDFSQVILASLKQVLNGIFNALIATFLSIFVLNKYKEVKLSFQVYIFSVIILFVSFSLYLMVFLNTKNIIKIEKARAIDKIEFILSHIKEDYKNYLKYNKTEDIEDFSTDLIFTEIELLKELEILIFKDEVLIASNADSSTEDFLIYKNIYSGDEEVLTKNIKFITPHLHNLPEIEIKSRSYFVAELTLNKHKNIKIVIKKPFSEIIRIIENYYIQTLTIMLGIIFLTSITSYFFSFFIVRGLERLKHITNDIPNKLLNKQPIHWEKVSILELDALNQNFQEISRDLSTLFKESEIRYQQLFDNAVEAMLVLDYNSLRIIEANSKAEMLFEKQQSILVTHFSIYQLINSFQRDDIFENFQRLEDEIFYVNNSTSSAVKIEIIPFKVKNKDVWLMTLRDITEQLENEKQMNLMATVFSTTSEGIVVTDDKHHILMVNRGFEAITGYKFEEVVGKNPNIIKSDWQDKVFYQEMWEKIKTKGFWEGEIWNKRKNGEIYAEWLSIYKVNNEAEHTTNFIAIFIDITEKKQSQEKINQLAFYDTLTSLPNRALFIDRLAQAIYKAKQKKTKLAVLILDIDNFKNINDSLGYQVGDLLLKNFANRIVSILPTFDTLARLGGDEFGIIIEEITHETEIVTRAENILQSFNEPFILNKETIYSSSSIGISFYPDDSLTEDDLIKNADSAMYLAKNNGKSNFAFYQKDLEKSAFNELKIQNDLILALENREFYVVYQPKINFHHKISGAEALIRWESKENGFISPEVFIPIAEKTGLMSKIEDYMIREVASKIREWKLRNIKLRVSVNISNYQFSKHNFVEQLLDIVKEERISPRDLDLELTERIVAVDDNEITDKLSRLKDLGFMLSLDDFGTGQSSLSYLQKFNIDKLKIEKSFIRDIPINKQNKTLTDAIILLAGAFDMNVIAEGVETETELNYLKERGCIEYQGYYFSKPLKAKDFEIFYFQNT